jgi:[protein-PII] uridylyltransferase
VSERLEPWGWVPLDLVGDPEVFLRESRQRIESFHEGAATAGSRVTRLYAAVADNTLRALHHRVAEQEPWAAESFAIVAAGGYGRRTLCPHSDIDMLLVADGPDGGRLQNVAESILYPLWNNRLQTGQHPGTPAELVDRARGDLHLQTSLLDLRYLAGSRSLYDRLKAEVAEGVNDWRAELLGRVRGENLARFARFGSSVFLLEPHVKEGKGGLRDFHWLHWIARLLHGLRGSYDLLISGLVEPDHYRQLVEAHEFLLAVRTELHLLAGRGEDRLRFESQEPVARALGFRKRGGLLAVERFMGAYYRNAYAMAHLTGLYVARMLGFYWDESEEAEGEPLEVGPSTPVSRRVTGTPVVSGDGLFVHDHGVRVLDPEALKRHPDRILDLFAFKQTVGGRLHHETLEHVRAALPRVNATFRRDRALAARFRAILEGPDVFRTLVAMHRSGFLGAYIPEFGACFCQAQHNRIHLYTVDVHSLYVVRELEDLARAPDDARAFADAWSQREQRAPLILAGLFHDIAKSHGAAHSRVGADVARSILLRMGWEEPNIARVQWLVRYHLMLSNTAYHRDVYDPATKALLVDLIPDRSHLDDLLALTWADSRATNPELLNGWKQGLLVQAYRAAVAALEGESPHGELEATRSRVEELLVAEVGRKRAPQLAERLFRKPDPSSLTRYEPSVLAELAVLLDRIAAGESFAASVRQQPEQGVSWWTTALVDRPGVFAILAGALTAAGFSIASAEATTRADGIAVDRFAVHDARGRPVKDERRWKRLERLVADALVDPANLDGPLERVRRSAPPTPPPGAMELQRFEVGNDASDVATVVEVVTPDRPGLVHAIAQELFEFGLDLKVAKISTRQDLASDTFYVVDRRGRRLGVRRATRLARSLRERFA